MTPRSERTLWREEFARSTWDYEASLSAPLRQRAREDRLASRVQASERRVAISRSLIEATRALLKSRIRPGQGR